MHHYHHDHGALPVASMPEPSPWSRLRLAAWLAFLVHLLAFLAMALILRQGLDTAELGDRLHFLAEHTLWWNLGWLVWNTAALTILYFYLCFVLAHQRAARPQAALWAAVLLTAAGVALDLGAEAIEMGVIPELARVARHESGHGPATKQFLTLHRLAMMLTGYGANGLYSISALLLAWTTRREYRIWEWPAGIAVGISGLGLSAAVLADSVEAMVLANIALGPALLCWLLMAALRGSAEPRG
jgi:hypothetical protein